MSQSLERKSQSQSQYSSQIPRLSSQSNIKREIEEQQSRIQEQLLEKYNQRYSKHSPYDKIFVQKIINNFLDQNVKKQKNLSILDNQIASILSDNPSQLSLINSIKSQNQKSDAKLMPNIKNQPTSTQSNQQKYNSTSLQFKNLLSDMDKNQIINNTLSQIDNKSLNLRLNSSSPQQEDKPEEARVTQISNYFSQTPQNNLEHALIQSPVKIDFYNPNQNKTLHKFHSQSTKLLNNQNLASESLNQINNFDSNGGIIQKVGEQTFIGHLLSQTLQKNQIGQNQVQSWFNKNWEQFSDNSSESDEKNNKQNNVEYDNDHNWAALVKLDSELYQKQNQLQKQKIMQTKKMMAESLALQIEQKNQQKLSQEKIQSQYVKIRDQMDKKHQDLEQEREREKQQMNYKFKNELDEQYAKLSKQQQKEKQKEKKVEEFFKNKFIEQLQNEEDDIKDKKVKQLNFYEKAISSHKNWYKLQQQEDQQGQIEDVLMIKSNCDNMEKIEKGKQDYKNENLEQIKISMEKSQKSLESMTQIRQKQLLNQQEKLELQKQQAEQEQNRREQRQIELKQEQMQKLRRELSQQIIKKNSQKEFQESINKKQAQIWKEDYSQYLQEMSEKERNFRHARLFNSKALEEQIKDQKPQDVQTMTKEEFLQNQNQILFYQSMLKS